MPRTISLYHDVIKSTCPYIISATFNSGHDTKSGLLPTFFFFLHHIHTSYITNDGIFVCKTTPASLLVFQVFYLKVQNPRDYGGIFSPHRNPTKIPQKIKNHEKEFLTCVCWWDFYSYPSNMGEMLSHNAFMGQNILV